jgi:hypothetical protein
MISRGLGMGDRSPHKSCALAVDARITPHLDKLPVAFQIKTHDRKKKNLYIA